MPTSVSSRKIAMRRADRAACFGWDLKASTMNINRTSCRVTVNPAAKRTCLLHRLAGRAGLDREGVDRAGEFVGQGGEDSPLAGNAAKALELGCFDHYIEMAFPAFARTGVAFM